MRVNTKKTILLVLVANLMLWAFFWVDFSRRLVPYREHPPAFEEASPVFVFDGKALPIEQTPTRCLRQIELIEAPSFWVVRPAVHILNRSPSSWQSTLAGISPWGYLLILVMLLSFLQWYFLSRLIIWLSHRVWTGGAT